MLTQVAVDKPAAPVKCVPHGSLRCGMFVCLERRIVRVLPPSDNRRRVSIGQHASQLFVAVMPKDRSVVRVPVVRAEPDCFFDHDSVIELTICVRKDGSSVMDLPPQQVVGV
jgi:hypothetical protein